MKLPEMDSKTETIKWGKGWATRGRLEDRVSPTMWRSRVKPSDRFRDISHCGTDGLAIDRR